ncbi:13274_t:CDS:1, partial [Gigaspora margarita]
SSLALLLVSSFGSLFISLVKIELKTEFSEGIQETTSSIEGVGNINH